MTDKEQVQGNSEEKAAEAAIFDSENNFFDNLENQVNGAIVDTPKESQPTEVTQSDIGSEQVTHNVSQDGSKNVEQTDWKERYKSSSREAIKMAQELKGLKPFVPVLEAMKKDSGLVDHVRNYLQSGGQPAKNVTEQLGLGEDFVYDPHEAVTNPDSDSAKVMDAHVNKMVQSRVGNILDQEKVNAARLQQQIAKKREEIAFKKKHEMSDEAFAGLVDKAKTHKLTLEDIYYILNKDKTAANVANSTKQDMLNQMKNVRNIPTSASDANSQPKQANASDNVFDALLGMDGDIDNLFS
jgi:hypothetical protein